MSESFVGKVFDLNTSLILLGKWPRSSPAVRRALFACFSYFLLNCRLATFHSEVKIVGTASFLITSCRKVVRGCQQTPNYKILFEAVFGKALCTNARMLRWRKPSYFIFVSRSPLSFGSWVNLKVLTLDFKWFSSKVHCEVETKTVSNFPHFLSSPTVSSQVLFLTVIRQFSRPLYDYEG